MKKNLPKNPSQWLPNLHSVSGTIALGFAIVLGLHLSIVVLGHYGLLKADKDLQTQEALRNRVELFYKIDRCVGELQRNVLLFTFSGYQSQEKLAEKIHQQLDELLKEASATNSIAYHDAEVLDKMQDHLATHREIFESVVIDRGKRRSLVDGELKICAAEFDGLVEQLGQIYGAESPLFAAVASFRFAQLQTMQFVNSPDSAHIRSAKQNLKKTRQWIESSGDQPQNTRDQLLEVVARYEAALIQMVQATRGYLHLVNVVLTGESQEFILLASQARDSHTDRAEHLTQEMLASNKQFHFSSNVFSVITIILGLLASWLISKNVAPPLNAITCTFDGLAKGQDCHHIPGLGRKDELGQLAAAAQIFKDQAAETERLLEEVTRMKEVERKHAHDQKLESLGQLAAGIAHEINTPMQCVASNVEFLEGSCEYMLSIVDECCHSIGELQAARELQEPGETFGKAFSVLTASRRFTSVRSNVPAALSEASMAVSRVIEIVHAMKSMSHPGSTDLQETNLNELLQDAATVTRSRWKYVAELELELDDSLPTLMTMPSEISQLMLNLIVNAADAIAEKYGGDGSLGSICIRTHCDFDTISIEVEDDGGGIPEEIRDRIFDPFFTTKEVGKGTGQGLAVSYNGVVRRHGGTMDVFSTLGEGSKFVITLPILNVESTPIAAI